MMVRLLLFAMLVLAFSFGDVVANNDDLDQWDNSERPTETCKDALLEGFYEVSIELDASDDSCNDQDYANMGILIQGIVADIDERIPDYLDEYMKTDICETPVTTGSHKRRSLGRYAAKYLGGGQCRRCKNDNTDRKYTRRMLREREDGRHLSGSGDGNSGGYGGGRGGGSGSGSSDSDDYLDACELSKLAKFEKFTAEMALESLQDVYEDMSKIAQKYGDSTDHSANKYLTQAQNEERYGKEEMDLVDAAIILTETACNDMPGASSTEIPSFPRRAQLSLLHKRALESYYAVKAAARNAREALSIALDLRVLMKQVLFVSSSVATEQGLGLEDMLDALNTEIAELKVLINRERDGSTVKAALKTRRNKLEDEAKTIVDSLKFAAGLSSAGGQTKEDIARAKYDMDTAESNSDWMEKFHRLLTLAVPHCLMEVYDTSEFGCLTEPPTVVVEVMETPLGAPAPAQECKNPYVAV